MSKATRATKVLQQAGVAFTLHTYDYQADADRIMAGARRSIIVDTAIGTDDDKLAFVDDAAQQFVEQPHVRV